MSTNQPNDKGPFGYSKAHESEVKSPDNEKSEAVQQLTRLVQDQQQQREEIDSIKVGMEQLAGKMQELVNVVNEQSKILGGSTQQTTDQNQVSINGQPQEKGPAVNQAGLIAIKDILDSKLGDRLLDRIFPTQQAAPALISQDVVNEKMTKAFMDDLETGESIRKFISDSLKKKATKTIVSKSLSDIGSEVQHEPA